MATLWVCAQHDGDIKAYLKAIRRQADIGEQALALGLKVEAQKDDEYIDIGIAGSPDALEPLVRWIHEESPHSGIGFAVWGMPEEMPALEKLSERCPGTICCDQE